MEMEPVAVRPDGYFPTAANPRFFVVDCNVRHARFSKVDGSRLSMGEQIGQAY